MAKKIGLLELHHETNSFSKVPTTRKDFGIWGIHPGAEAWVFAKEKKSQIWGLHEAAREHGNGQIELYPVFSAWAMPGGPIAREDYQYFRDLLENFLKENSDLDGFYFSLHGAMGVEGLGDPESDLLQLVRDYLGNEIPIGVSFDLHANVTEANARLATFIYGYQTNPHRDHYKCGYTSGKILVDAVLGRIKPVMSYQKMPLLKGGGLGIEFLPPIRGIWKKMRKMEKIDGVLAVSNFMIHIWIDHPESGWSTVVITDDKKSLGDELAAQLADLNWAVREKKHPELNSPELAIRKAKRKWLKRRLGTLVFCDVSDAVGAGAPGENTRILQAILTHAPGLRSYVPLRDEVVAEQLFDQPVGQQVSVTVGAKLDPIHNLPLEFTGELIFAKQTDFGKTVILRNRGTHLIITELAFGGFFPTDFTQLGLSLWKADITVVKNLFPFRFRFWKYNRGTFNVGTRGVTNLDVFELGYKEISRPIYPLDPLENWR
ncbi:MAG: M81 family metallopeptidase [Bacteroidia bacterium]|nr:M81 family metallopeptidase [Bacteroidia bacterium]